MGLNGLYMFGISRTELYITMDQKENILAVAALMVGSPRLSNVKGGRVGLPSESSDTDEKNVVIQAPIDSDSCLHNYKETSQLSSWPLWMHITCSGLINMGAYRRTSDSGILSNSGFGEGLLQLPQPVTGTLDIPEDEAIPGAEHQGKFP